MLQKLSKCEVKSWLWWNFIILPSLQFYVKSLFGVFKQSKNVILAILEVLNFDFSKFEQLSSYKFTKNSPIHQNLISLKNGVTAKWSNFNKVKP